METSIFMQECLDKKVQFPFLSQRLKPISPLPQNSPRCQAKDILQKGASSQNVEVLLLQTEK